MRKLMVALSAAAMLGASTFAALAAEANGTIKSIDTTAHTVTLASGETYMLPQKFDAASLSVGQKVQITYEKSSSGQMQASEVVPSS